MSTGQQRGRNAILIACGLAVLAGLVVLLLEAFVQIDAQAHLLVERAQREQTMAWLARGLLALGALWITIGIIAARTSLVRRPGAAATRATWLSFSRPWRARESMLGLLALDRWLMVIVPAGMLIATHLIIASFLSVLPALITSAGWFVFGAVAIILIWPRSVWPILAALSGTAIVWCMLMLAGCAIWGPGTFWVMLWSIKALRLIVLTLVLAVLAWAVIAAGGAITPQVGSRTATGVVFCSLGATIAVLALTVAILGPEWVGSQWQDETIELATSPSTTWVIAAIGTIIFAGGLVATIQGRRLAVLGGRARHR